ncbi:MULTISPECIES: isoamylase early set domain-containing protein [Galbibacter]|uniref:Isoamylase early set domain-containing protein n=1 Tax=Galbibacter pacificus TaxID=2996052 RepID=A0ABT6FMG4_9FLAO|nr:isoamylase early set domain-containing protein [Galbibacter pacificus]MDG3580975.1 isoamylase early set domain-containing protein [Galbibacter pacificus]MDG3584453.1 isoamylase early set domain-containing protein [Galbibacter pacificus]
MAISKQYLKSRPVCKVTFTVPAEEANEVVVVGDFNQWNPEEASLKKLKNGNFKGTFEIPKDSTYEFRYIIDGNYTNEIEADAFQWNDYAGTENAVLFV